MARLPQNRRFQLPVISQKARLDKPKTAKRITSGFIISYKID
jgi:hypothetical protein